MKVLLKRKNINYNEIKILSDNFDDFKKEHNVETLPQLYHGTQLIGGYTNTLKLPGN